MSVMVLTEILRHEHRRLATGATLRNYLHSQLALGNEPNHPRLDFLRNGVHVLLDTLQGLGERFDADNPNDRVGIGDLVDILQSTMRTIRARTGYRGD